MKLRVIEIEAINQAVTKALTEKLKIPDYSKELKEYEKGYNEVLTIQAEIERLTKKKNELTNTLSISSWNASAANLPKDVKMYESNLRSKFISAHLPNSMDIQNDILLSANKDLGELVKELVAKYSK